MTIGEQLNSSAKEWTSKKNRESLRWDQSGGVSFSEGAKIKAPEKNFSNYSELPSKGWADISEAMRQLQGSIDFDWSLDFTGNEPTLDSIICPREL